MTSKLKTHFKHFMIGSLIAALGASAYVIAAVTFSDFTTGTTISSSEMNAKLNALKDAVNANATPVTVVASVSIVANGGFGSTVVLCPAGYNAIGGGVDFGSGSSPTVVTSSAPAISGFQNRLIQLADGTYGPANGWQGSGRNNETISLTLKVGVICVPAP